MAGSILALLMILFVTSCASSDRGQVLDDEKKDLLQEDESVQEIEPDIEAETETEAEADPQKPETFWREYEKVKGGDLSIAWAQSFSDGVTWINVAEKEKNSFSNASSQMMLINKAGEVIYKFPQKTDKAAKESESVFPSNFMENVGLVTEIHKENGEEKLEQYLINTDGEMIWSVAEDGWSEAARIFGEGAVESIVMYPKERNHSKDRPCVDFCGFTGVSMEVNTFEDSGRADGILKPDGTWFVEPAIDTEIEIIPNWKLAGIKYMAKEEGAIINLVTGEVQSQELYGKSDYISVFAGPGTLNPAGDYWVSFTQEDFIYGEGSRLTEADIAVNTWVAKKSIEDVPVFKDGYCVLWIRNTDNEPYFTVIDIKGNQLFEPKKCPKYYEDKYGYVSDGRILAIGEKRSPEYCVFDSGDNVHYYNMQGEELPGVYREAYPYSCGIALVKPESSDSYIFIDVDGNEIFPQ